MISSIGLCHSNTKIEINSIAPSFNVANMTQPASRKMNAPIRTGKKVQCVNYLPGILRTRVQIPNTHTNGWTRHPATKSRM